jgi:hypothetical protein
MRRFRRKSLTCTSLTVQQEEMPDCHTVLSRTACSKTLPRHTAAPFVSIDRWLRQTGIRKPDTGLRGLWRTFSIVLEDHQPPTAVALSMKWVWALLWYWHSLWATAPICFTLKRCRHWTWTILLTGYISLVGTCSTSHPQGCGHRRHSGRQYSQPNGKYKKQIVRYFWNILFKIGEKSFKGKLPILTR